MSKSYIILAAAIALGGCMAETNTAMDASMESGAAPVAAVNQFIGKSLVSDNATFIFNADGSVGGTFRGEPIVGTYTSTATEICSSYSAPGPLSGVSVCSTPSVSGDEVVFNRRDGSQSPAYTISG